MSIHTKDLLSSKSKKNDIDSKIADFMADIDEIVLGKTSNTKNEQSQWQECFDETTQAVYYWNTKTNECSWDPPSSISDNQSIINKKRSQIIIESKSSKKLKKTSLIAEYTSSESENEEKNVDEIDNLLEKVLDKDDEQLPSNDLYPLFEADCRAALARLSDLADRSKDILILQIQLETRLNDCLAGHLSKSYAVTKLEQALIKINEFEKLYLTKSKPSLTTNEMALLLSLPPPPPPPNPPPLSNESDSTIQSFDIKSSHHNHKDKKSKQVKTLPTDLIQKWAYARQELRSTIPDIDDS